MSQLDWSEVESVLAGALELPQHLQAAYVADSCSSRDDIRAEVESLLAAHWRAESFLQLETTPVRPAAEESLEGRYFGPYRLIERVGIGGMGVVYRAERDDGRFHKEVAIKVVAAALESPELLRRFSGEQQILATLEHPNIARIIDAGVSGESVPYLVMEYVHGVPLTEYCNARQLSIAGRLRLFRIVCSAVQYAHQHLVVHRDLKPANILVLSCGTPKLLDFGIAKILGDWESSGGGRTLFEPLTPAYASPEQLRGDTLTTVSDVYSLGVILCELLTGVRPDRTSESPSESLRHLGDDLDAIVLKSIREDARERYASAEDLSTDIGRYLDGMPVQAHRTSFYYVTRKFVARHRLAVAMTLMAVILAMAGVITVLWEARVAERERAKAQRRFEDVRQLANSVLFELHDGIATLPGATPVRKLLADRALHYLDSLGREAEGDPALQMELAAAYARLGDVQGSGGLSNLGDSTGALASYGKARKILSGVLRATPDRLDSRRALAKLCLSISSVEIYLRNNVAALADAEEALALWEAVASATHSDEEARRGVASAYHAIAGAHSLDNLQASLVSESKALGMFEALLAAHPGSSRDQRNVAIAHKNIGNRLQRLNRFREALDHHRKAAELDSRRVAADGRDYMAKLDLSFDFSEMGYIYQEQGELREALKQYRDALGLRLTLADADPQDARTQGRLSYMYLRLAGVFLKQGDWPATLAHAQRTIQISGNILTANRVDTVNLSYVAEAQSYIGDAERAMSVKVSGAEALPHRQRACSSYRQSLNAYRELELRAAAQKDERKEAARVAGEVAVCEKMR
jgi:tetratricopeptide (TPR) repeat protein